MTLTHWHCRKADVIFGDMELWKMVNDIDRRDIYEDVVIQLAKKEKVSSDFTPFCLSNSMSLLFRLFGCCYSCWCMWWLFLKLHFMTSCLLITWLCRKKPKRCESATSRCSMRFWIICPIWLTRPRGRRRSKCCWIRHASLMIRICKVRLWP